MTNLTTQVTIKNKIKIIDFRKIYFETWRFSPKRVLHAEYGRISQVLHQYNNPPQYDPVTQTFDNLLGMDFISQERVISILQGILRDPSEWDQLYLDMLSHFVFQYDIVFGQQYHTLEKESYPIFHKSKEDFFYKHMLVDFNNQTLYDLEDIEKLLKENDFSELVDKYLPKIRKAIIAMQEKIKREKNLFYYY